MVRSQDFSCEDLYDHVKNNNKFVCVCVSVWGFASKPKSL